MPSTSCTCITEVRDSQFQTQLVDPDCRWHGDPRPQPFEAPV